MLHHPTKMAPCGGRLQVRWLREQAAAEGERAQAQMRLLTAALAQAQAHSACELVMVKQTWCI